MEDNTLITFAPSEKLLEYIRAELGSIDSTESLPRGIGEIATGNDKAVVYLEDLYWVKERRARSGRFLWDLIVGSEMLLPSPPEQPRNPELEARCRRLRKEQEDREYRAMTRMVDPKRYKEPEESIAYAMKQINRQLIGVAQLVFSVAAGFLFGYLGLELIIGGLDMRVRLLSGIGCALIIAIADLYFLIVHLSVEEAATNKSDAQQQQQQQQKPIKTNSRPHQD